MGNTSYSEPSVGLESLSDNDLIKNDEIKREQSILSVDNSIGEKLIDIRANGDWYIRGKKVEDTQVIIDAILSTDKMRPITTQDMIEQGYVYAKACPLVGQPVWYKKEYQDALLDTICYNYSYYPHAKTIVYTSPAYGVLRKQVNTVKDLIEFYDFLESVQRVGETAR